MVCITSILCNDQAILCRIAVLKDDSSFFCSAVYASNIQNDRRVLWNHLQGFFFFWIIKNLLPKGQCPTNNQEYKEPRPLETTKIGQHLPYKHRKGASARNRNQQIPIGKPTKQTKPTYRAEDRQSKTKPHKQGNSQTKPRPNNRPQPGQRQPRIPKETIPQPGNKQQHN